MILLAFAGYGQEIKVSVQPMNPKPNLDLMKSLALAIAKGKVKNVLKEVPFKEPATKVTVCEKFKVEVTS